ncbi:MAG: S1C family serine protease [Opitutaceae bacterium]
MKSARPLIVAVATLAAAISLPLRGAPATEAAAGRALVKRYVDTIVGIELVVTLRVKMQGQERPPQEQRIEINGTVISPSGLTVTSLAAVDPQVAFSQPGSRVELLGADFKEVKLRLADGTEIPARFVLKDSDLDLAFMAPDTAENPTARDFNHVKLAESAEAALLENFYYVARAPKVLQRIPLVRSAEVIGIIEKPRKLYLLSDQSLGTPMFDAQGRVLGISVQNFAGGRAAGMVVMPSADIAEMAKQAAAAQAAPPPAPTPAPAPPADTSKQ